MSDRPHSVLVTHELIEQPRTHGEAINGYAAGCLACRERDEATTEGDSDE